MIMIKTIKLLALFILMFSFFCTTQVYAQSDSNKIDDKQFGVHQGVTNVRLDELIRRVDKNAKGQLGFWSLIVDSVEVQMITDASSNTHAYYCSNS